MFARHFLYVFHFSLISDLFSFPVIHGDQTAEYGNHNAG